jgi:hypothetical protein
MVEISKLRSDQPRLPRDNKLSKGAGNARTRPDSGIQTQKYAITTGAENTFKKPAAQDTHTKQTVKTLNRDEDSQRIQRNKRQPAQNCHQISNYSGVLTTQNIAIARD